MRTGEESAEAIVVRKAGKPGTSEGPKNQQKAINRPTAGGVARSHRPERMDPASHAQMFLAEVENAARTLQRAQAIGRSKTLLGQRLECQGSMADGAALRDATRAEEPNAQAIWIHHPLGNRGGMQVISAGFNRRMRKTARPLVWKGHGAQSP